MLLALFAGVFRYVDQHFHTPETFLENTSSLADNADIRERLVEGFRQEIILIDEGEPEAEADAEGSNSITDLLADEDDAPDPVRQQKIDRDQAIEEILLDVFDSELYNEVFADALQFTRQDVIASAELEPRELLREDGEVWFNMRGLYPTIYQQLAADERTAQITQNEVPAEYGIFKVADRETTIEPLWAMLRNGPNWRGLTLLGAIACFIGAVVLAERRPSTAIQFGTGLIGVGVVTVVIIYLIRFIVPLLAGGGASANPVVATYAATTSPLVGMMLRLAVLGAAIAAIGGIARLIWPDDWVYSNVSDERGVRSIKRRRGAPEPARPEAQQPVPAAAAVPVGYPGYPQPYPGAYPPQWQGYPGYGPPPGYPAPYPTGPFAQPAHQQQQYTSPGRPTVPVTPVRIGSGEELVAPPAPALDGTPRDLPDDAAQVVPKVVARAETTLEESTAAAKSAKNPKATTQAPADVPQSTKPAAKDSSAKESSAKDTVAEVPRVAEQPVVPPIVPVIIPSSDDPTGERASSKGTSPSDDQATKDEKAETKPAAASSDTPIKGDLIEASDDEWAAEQDW